MSTEMNNQADPQALGVIKERFFQFLSVVFPPFGFTFFAKNVKFKSRKWAAISMLILSSLTTVIVVWGSAEAIIHRIKYPESFATTDNTTNKYIALVKNGVLEDYPSMDLGEALSKGMTNVKWEHIKASDGNDYVNVTGDYTYMQTKMNIFLQYKIIDSMTFAINAVEANKVQMDNAFYIALMEEFFKS